MFAIVDIETTGGYAAHNDIIELAIVLHDGEKMTDRFCSLVAYDRPLPRFIESLTGIRTEMLLQAPTFAELAPRVAALLQDRVFVAHHVNFDYSFVRHHLAAAGITFQGKRLCTVRLAKKVFPGLPSYSLGNLCRQLGIPITNRHRAGGDADATAILFQRMVEKAGLPFVEDFLRKSSREHYLPAHLDKSQIDQLPYTPGVYYFHDNKDKIVYVGKAVNIKYRVLSHFTHNGPGKQRQEFLRTIHKITYRSCPSELAAMVFESIEIRRLWPPFNRSQKRFTAVYGLYLYTDQRGYLRLVIDKKKRNQVALFSFGLLAEGHRVLQQLIRRHGLCPKLCYVQTDHEACIGEQEGYCQGACRGSEDQQSYNARVKAAVENLQEHLPSFAIFTTCEQPGYQHCMLVDKGSFYGMGEVPLHVQAITSDILKPFLTPYPENEYIRGLLFAHADKWQEGVVRFDPVRSHERTASPLGVSLPHSE